jgi:hypothetical protein
MTKKAPPCSWPGPRSTSVPGSPPPTQIGPRLLNPSFAFPCMPSSKRGWSAPPLGSFPPSKGSSKGAGPKNLVPCEAHSVVETPVNGSLDPKTIKPLLSSLAALGGQEQSDSVTDTGLQGSHLKSERSSKSGPGWTIPKTKESREARLLCFKREEEEGGRHLHPSLYTAGYTDKAVRNFLHGTAVMGNLTPPGGGLQQRT